MMGMLSDLKHLSNARPAVLPLLTEDLVHLIGHSSRQIRGLSYELVLRLLRHSPTTSTAVVPTYVSCFESPDPAVAFSAVEKLPDICPLAQEELNTILGTAFNLGLYSNIGVTSYICDTIAVLNSQAGY